MFESFCFGLFGMSMLNYPNDVEYVIDYLNQNTHFEQLSGTSFNKWGRKKQKNVRINLV